MSQGKNILIYRLPSLIAEAIWFGIIGKEHIALPEHGAGAQSVCTIFIGQFLIKSFLQNCYFYSIHICLTIKL